MTPNGPIQLFYDCLFTYVMTTLPLWRVNGLKEISYAV